MLVMLFLSIAAGRIGFKKKKELEDFWSIHTEVLFPLLEVYIINRDALRMSLTSQQLIYLDELQNCMY